MSEITGQIFFRETPYQEASPPGKKLVMFTGIIAVPEESTEFKGEHMYSLFGMSLPEADVVDLHIMLQSKVDITQKVSGSTIGQVLTLPIWRV